MNIIESILSTRSLSRAAERFEAYRWTTGVNAESKPKVLQELERLKPELIEAVRNCKYKPLPLFWERTKVTGKTLRAHALLVFDCTLQQAIHDRVFPIIEPLGAQPFSHDWFAEPEDGALERYLAACLAAARSGYGRVLAIDARLGFNDRVRGRIPQLLNDTLRDRALVSLISKYLNVTDKAASELGEKRSVTYGPLHHLLLEIALLPLCAEIEGRNYPHVRRGGQMRVFLRFVQKGNRLCGSFTRFIQQSCAFDEADFDIAHTDVTEPDFWGYCIRQVEGTHALGMHENAVRDFRRELTRNTARSFGDISNRQRAVLVSQTVKRYARHFRYAQDTPEIADVDAWLCRRVRMDYLKCWKTPKGKINGLMRFGIPFDEAKVAGSTHLNWWAASDISTVKKALSKSALRSEGYLLPLEAFEHNRIELPTLP